MDNENEQENNSINETSNEPIIPLATPAPLTLQDVGGNIDKLYEAHKSGKIVDFPPWIVEIDRDVQIIPQELYIHIVDTQPILSVKLGNSRGILLYIYKNGVYHQWTDSDVKAHIKSFFPRKIRKPKYSDEVFKELKTDYANTEESELNADENIINFQNGILELTTGNLLDHHPKYISTIQIPCEYKQNLKLENAPVFSKFLNDLTGGNADDIATLLEVIGLVISNVKGSRFKKLLILKGPGNTGKSVLRELVIQLIGLENSHTVDIKQLHRTIWIRWNFR